MMAVPLRILLAEDSDDGVAIVLQALRRAGYEPTAIGVDDSPHGRQRDLLRLVLDASPDLIFVKDSSGRFTMANRAVAELYGTTVDQLMGKSESDVNPQAEETLRSAVAEQDVIASGRPTFATTEGVTDPRTRSTRWFDIRRLPLVVPGVTGCQVLAIAIETTDRRLAESALRMTDVQVRQAQKMEAIGQLAGGVAHDFNNLLTAILGYTALLIEATRDQPELAADLAEIKKAGERASSLTRQLLTFSRKQVVQPALLNLNDVVAELEKVLRQVIGDEIELETIKAPGLGKVRADPNQIEQVLVSLAVNARDAMPEGGVLRIETRREVLPANPRAAAAAPSPWPCVTLLVSDTGTGIPPENIDRVFEPFFTTKGPGKGTGLGLSTVYGIVNQSSGVVSVESERNRGTTFSIRFPAVEEPAAVAAPAARPSVPYAGTETILLVEDEPGVRQLVQRVLSRRGYHVLDAGDVTHAFEIATEYAGPIHLLLSDVVMPGLSGPDLAKRIVAKRPEIRVLYMSGFASRLSSELGSPSAGVTILHKPFTPESLARTVRDCLDDVIVGTFS
jgi:two-component system, cell cycle sensor histidine kinase and response regulator CckA